MEPDIENGDQDIQDDQASGIEEHSWEAQFGDIHEGIGIEIRQTSADEDDNEIDDGVDQPDGDLLKANGEGAFIEVPVDNHCDGDYGMQ